ncbi:ABC transporter related [Micromonospora sp. ATCC 39149]|uniref:ABC transporter ATP-binding protein n=1 Tax=Micromonospora carbonacea TaxID=47853 RepID=A0A7D5Y6U6_9ACTN|nr:ABC transporter ATP-binding protein [Micromonospora sp. ATCC 39149]EEP70662.1 ABC transporter related [Micromonospora sp. ATCC 39149]QLJ97019.1 ABC transporter ATP-binding protein [Micromonospora carbonacea]
MIRRLLRYSSSRARRLLLAELGFIVATAVLQGVAFVMLVPLLRALFLEDMAAVRSWLIALTAVGAAYAVAFWFASQIGMKASTAVLSSLLERLGDRLVELPMAWFGTDRSGLIADIATRGAMFVSSTPYSTVRLILTGFITPGTVLVGMVFLDWRLAVAMAATVPVMWFAFRWLRTSMERDDVEHAASVAEASNRVIEFARVQPALRMAGTHSVADRLVEDALQHQHRAYRGLLITGGAGIATFAGVVQLALTVIIVLGAYLAVGGSLEPATLIALLVLGVRFTEPISNSGALGGGVAVATTTLNQLDDLSAVTALPEPTTRGTPADWGIAFDDVTFGYGGDPVLRHLSFTAPAGRMTAIVGPSGSGKTTIIKLMARLYDPERGSVSIGGVAAPQLGTDVVEAAVAPVFQDVYLFDDTILNNVWIGNPDLDREQVIAAATRARVDEIVARLPQGWNTRVGEGGSNLSGGERQRVSIARALLKDAPIILLDEATAALDIGNEIALSDALDALRSDRTMIVVAHRLSTIMTADQILMLDGNGGIQEAGTHAELLAAGGAYAHYWRERVDATGWQLAPHD